MMNSDNRILWLIALLLVIYIACTMACAPAPEYRLGAAEAYGGDDYSVDGGGTDITCDMAS